LPEQPDTFRIELSGSACYGSCPTYKAAIDQDGNVSFVGETCVTRPGAFSNQVDASDARAIYDALRATKYAELGDRYTSEEEGCEAVLTDGPTYGWNVQADDEQKSLVRDSGCEGVDGLNQVDAVMSVFEQRAGLLQYLQPKSLYATYCDQGIPKLVATELRLSYDGAALGVLKIESAHGGSGSFSLEDCSGALLAEGDVESDSGRWLLLAKNRQSIALPADLGEAGSLVVEFNPHVAYDKPNPILGARALRQDDDVVFDFALASSCQP
jgi:hypothetical protein